MYVGNASSAAVRDRYSSHMRRTRSAVIGTFVIVVVTAGVQYPAAAAELQPQTTLAYDAYLDGVRRAFLARARSLVAPSPSTGVLSAGPARDDGIINVPGGLVHHWKAAAFIRRATLRQGLDVSSAFANYHAVYKAVIRSRLLGRNGDAYTVLMRLEGGEAGVHAVLDVRSTVEYVYPSSGVALAFSHADKIREVQQAGRPDERMLEPGRDSGYLWRAATFTYFR
jgi:hypothetical protein